MKQKTTQPILLSPRQIERLKEIQEKEYTRSNIGIKPSIHEVARQLVDKALKEVI